jgi:hypothetical protein
MADATAGGAIDEELDGSNVPGYKPGAKKTAEELAALDAADESLRKWKESLGLKANAAGAVDASSGRSASLSVSRHGKLIKFYALETPG